MAESSRFDDISPLKDSDVKERIQELLVDPGFQHAVSYIIPDVNWDDFSSEMSKYNTKEEFQTNIIYQVMCMLANRVTSGLDGEGWENIDKSVEHLFLSNHRDIVLDAGFMNILRHKYGFRTTEIAIGDNLLIHKWIDTLVRLNKSFIVRRGVSGRQILLNSKHLSDYIHYVITQKEESIWMAQREGRAKDSDDLTQDSLIKMIAMSPENGNIIDNLKELNIIPLSISYEYDPCDYLKAKEFQLKRDNPDYKKTQRDDLLNMEMGILGFKGRVIFKFGKCINPELDKIKEIEPDKRHQIDMVARAIDKNIHFNYEIFPCNYIAYDLLHESSRFANKYTLSDIDTFKEYLNKQIAKIDIDKVDYEFVWHKLLEMYSNTLKNYLIAHGE